MEPVQLAAVLAAVVLVASELASGHPAHIPQEVAVRPREHPAIPARYGSESPALAGNPRLLPLSP